MTKSKNENVFLSIIVPTYNSFTTFTNCIDSILKQMNKTCECIVVDDGSQDIFIYELKSYEEKIKKEYLDLNISFIYVEHQGPSNARNIGIKNAKGEYIAFLDSDDEMQATFINQFLKDYDDTIDWYIYSIEAVKVYNNHTESEKWILEDKIYNSSMEYASEYIKNHHLLLYSQCNKIYRKDILLNSKINFDSNVDFGEDRLINFEYLKHVEKIKTSHNIMFKYFIRYNDKSKASSSMSHRYIKNYFDKALYLHKKKIECINSLAKNVASYDKHRFEQYDLRREIENAIDRFEYNIEEEKENINKINEIIFGNNFEIKKDADIVVVLGSSKCEYRIEKAYECYGNNENTIFILSGGNLYDNSTLTEAEFMKKYLLEKGIKNENIIVENVSHSTEENLLNVSKIIDEYETQWENFKESIVIISAGFHMIRVQNIVNNNNYFSKYKVYYLPAYGSLTTQSNWYKNDYGKEIVLDEIESR